MRAAVLRQSGQPLTIDDVTLAPPASGEVLVRVEAAGVCHTDYHYMTGDMAAPLPLVLGHEGSGIVEALGPNTTGRVAIGDRVALMWRPRCGECAACVAGNPVLCVLGRVQASTGGLLDGTSRLSEDDQELHHFLGVSCFAERVVTSERSVVVVPAGVSAEIAAIAGCAVITGVGAVLNVVDNAAGRALVVFGAGGVGLSAVMGATLVGANPIIVVDVDDQKLELATDLGATHVVNSSSTDAVAAILEIAPEGARWAIEAIGRSATLEQAFAAVEAGGTVVAVGLGAVDATFAVPINQLVQRQKQVIGSLYGSANPRLDLPRIFELYLAGRLPLEKLLGDRYTLEEVNDAYERLIAGAVGRAIIIP